MRYCILVLLFLLPLNLKTQIVNFENSCVKSEVFFSFLYEHEVDSVKWDFGNGNFSYKKLASNVYKYPGYFKVKLYLYLNGAVIKYSNYIEIFPEPVYDISIDNLEDCLPHRIMLSTDNNYSSKWYYNDLKVSSKNYFDTTFKEINGLKHIHNIKLKLENKYGCERTIDLENMVISYKKPLANFEIVDYFDHAVLFENKSRKYTEYNWKVESEEYDQVAKLKLKLSEYPNIYDFKLTVINSNSCIDEVKGTLNVRDSNIFYLNNTLRYGDNMKYKPLFINGFKGSDYSFKICNKAGDVIFKTTNIDKGWIPKSDIKKGIYFYVIEYNDFENEKVFLIGHFEYKN